MEKVYRCPNCGNNLTVENDLIVCYACNSKFGAKEFLAMLQLFDQAKDMIAQLTELSKEISLNINNKITSLQQNLKILEEKLQEAVAPAPEPEPEAPVEETTSGNDDETTSGGDEKPQKAPAKKTISNLPKSDPSFFDDKNKPEYWVHCQALKADFEMRGGTLVKYKGKNYCVKIPETVTRLGPYCFANTPTTKVIMTKNIKTVEAHAFAQSKVAYLDFEPGCRGIQFLPDCFYLCYQLKKVNAASLQDWMSFSFADSSNPLSKTRDLYIGYRLLDELVLDSGITKVPNNTFRSWSGHTVTIEATGGTLVIGENAFFNCSNLTTVQIPARVCKIGKGAFLNCLLKNVTFIDPAPGKIAQPLKLGTNAFGSNSNVQLPNRAVFV